MSVNQNHYVMIGAKFEYDEFYRLLNRDEEEFNMSSDGEFLYSDSAHKGIEHYNNLCICSDGMSGEYVYVGYVIQKSKPYGDINDYNNTDNVPFPERVQTWIHREFGINVECSTIAFTHYT